MTSPPLVLDSEALAALAESRPPAKLRGLLTKAHDRNRPVLVPAVICAEVCRGVAHTRAVEAALERYETRRGDRPAVRCVDTDFELAKRVGAILHAAGSGSADLADAHVVAVCARFGGGIVATSDPDDMHRLAEAVPAIRVTTRSPR